MRPLARVAGPGDARWPSQWLAALCALASARSPVRQDDPLRYRFGYGGMSQADHLKAIERLGTQVAPVVRREVEGMTEEKVA